jgi:GH43 family beta-xylosidase
MRRFAVLCFAAFALLAMPAAASADAPWSWTHAPTYFNDASLPAADPYVLHDQASGFYYAYSTEGADAGYDFAIYRSADLATWEKLPGGALPANDPKQWGNDWFWAPEVYYNARTGWYFMFYAARSDANTQRWFGYASFEEPCKIGVAVSRSPAGPFHNIASQPIDFNPYDPDYHDVNLLMGPDQKQPPATLAAGEQAPLGTYIPTIDPDVYFDGDGRQYLYVSRNAYRNWNWDTDLGKYVEESNIIAVPLTTAWWNDPSASTMPTIAPAYQGANDRPGGPAGPRRDGYVTVLDYDHDKQAWENADVNDYALSGGAKKDRRWEEGSSILHAGGTYYLTYSANNWETPQYGVGYATASSPLGPFKKSPTNPILAQKPAIGMYSTGHGSFAASPDGRDLYYVHHGRPTPDDPQRRLYTDRARLVHGRLSIDASTTDEPLPSGVAPIRIRASVRHGRLRWSVVSAAGVPFALANPLNRVVLKASRGVRVAAVAPDGATVSGKGTVTLTYQRKLASGGYRDVVRAQVGVT